MEQRRFDPRGAPLIALSSVLFAGMAIVTRLVGQGASVGQLVVIRFAVGLVGLGALFLWRRERPRTAKPGLLLARGALGGVAVLLYFVAIQQLGVGPATLLNYSSPIFATLFAFLFLGERVTPLFTMGLVMATVGAGLVGYGTGDAAHPFSWSFGVVAGAASAVFSGAAVTSVRALRPGTSAEAVFFAFCVCGCVIGLPFALADWRPLSPWLWMLTLAVGLLSLGAQLLFTYAFGYVSASAGAVVMQLTPALSWVFGLTVLGERTTPLAVLGAVLCVGGVLLGSVLRQAVNASRV